MPMAIDFLDTEEGMSPHIDSSWRPPLSDHLENGKLFIIKMGTGSIIGLRT